MRRLLTIPISHYCEKARWALELAAAVLMPPEYGVRLPQPEQLPDPMASAIRGFREHPAGAYALRLFREQR